LSARGARVYIHEAEYASALLCIPEKMSCKQSLPLLMVVYAQGLMESLLRAALKQIELVECRHAESKGFSNRAGACAHPSDGGQTKHIVVHTCGKLRAHTNHQNNHIIFHSLAIVCAVHCCMQICQELET
jgi:hypothetical protein